MVMGDFLLQMDAGGETSSMFDKLLKSYMLI